MAKRRLYTRQDGKWAWQLVVNGNIVATAGDPGYENEDEARDMADRIIGGQYADAKKTIRRRATRKKTPASTSSAAKRKPAQRPGKRAATSGQHPSRGGSGDGTVAKRHRPPPARRRGEQRVNVDATKDATKNESGRQARGKSQTTGKKVAARAKTQSARGSTAAGRSAGGSVTSAELRAWAQRNGYAVSDRGRLPAHISAAYRDAHRR